MILIEEPGTYADVDFRQGVLVLADDVTIRGGKVDASGEDYGVANHLRLAGVNRPPRNTRVLGVEVTRSRKKALRLQSARVEGCELHECGEDGIFFDVWNGKTAVVFTGNRLHHLGNLELATHTSRPHADGAQVAFGSVIRITGNDFDLPNEPGYLVNSCLLLESELGRIHDVVVARNRFRGGGYALQVKRGDRALFPPPWRILVGGNDSAQRNEWLGGWEYGALRLSNPDLVRWEDDPGILRNLVSG